MEATTTTTTTTTTFDYHTLMLGRLSMEQALDEPVRLARELGELQRQEEALAMQNYRAFIKTSEAVGAMRTPMAEIGARLARVAQTALPSLSGQLAGFAEHMAQLQQASERNQRTLDLQLQLYDLVDIPLAMDSFVQKGAANLDFYEHALALYAYALQLGAAYPDLPLVQKIVASVRASAAVMAGEFKNQLRQPIQLAVCLRVIGFLRRLGVLAEPQLRATFLHCRQAYLHGLVAAIDTAAGAYLVANRFIDISRSALFDIVTQYKAIFLDDASDAGDVLHAWTAAQIVDFVDRLDAYLADVTEGAHTSSLLDQSMYFAMSLGRVGADFRPLLVPLFARKVRQLFNAGVDAALRKLVAAVKTFQWSEQSRVLSYYAGKGSHNPYDPPTQLLQHPPLAVFCNGCLATLNEFRHCAFDQVEDDTRRHFDAVLADASAHVHAIDPALFPTPDARAQLLAATDDVLLPYLRRAYARIWSPPTQTITIEDTPTTVSHSTSTTSIHSTETLSIDSTETLSIDSTDTLSIDSTETLSINSTDTLSINSTDTLSINSTDTLSINSTDTLSTLIGQVDRPSKSTVDDEFI